MNLAWEPLISALTCTRYVQPLPGTVRDRALQEDGGGRSLQHSAVLLLVPHLAIFLAALILSRFPILSWRDFWSQGRPGLTFLLNVSKCEVAHRMCKRHSSHFSSQYSPKFCIVGELYSIRLLVPWFQAWRSFAICSADSQCLCDLTLVHTYSIEYQVPLIRAIIFPISLHSVGISPQTWGMLQEMHSSTGWTMQPMETIYLPSFLECVAFKYIILFAQ